MKRFTELDAAVFEDAILIVDVDGTITNDRSSVLIPEAKEMLRRLTAKNKVYLCSNGPDAERIRALAAETGTHHLDSIHKKPSARIIENIAGKEGKRIVVIGDKRLTDGRFAKNIGAEFVHVLRVRHIDDSLHIRGIYLADDLHFFASAAFRLVRPTHWIKNFLVFAPIFFAHTVFDFEILANAAWVFIAFCTAASAVYVLNDLIDRDRDRAHPSKRTRPIASGEIGTLGALLLLAFLLAVTFCMLLLVPSALLTILLYLGLNVAYSFALKHIAVWDIVVIAALYVLRVIAGGEATGTYVSPWIMLCVFFGVLVPLIGKRRAEFDHEARRPVLEGYTRQSLDFLLLGSAALAVISYALWSVIGAESPLVVFSTVFVVIAVFRIVNRLYSGTDKDAEFPEKLLFKDRPALVAGALWVLFMFAVLYA